MARRRTVDVAKMTVRRLAEGRGSGVGPDFKPWLTIRDFPSRGRIHRIPGLKTGRVHHLFSDLERGVFVVLEWADITIDLNEQFPLLPVEETLSIATELGVRHPTDPSSGDPIVMTTDIRQTCRSAFRNFYSAVDAKYAADLEKPRVCEKLSIARVYWNRRHVKHYIVTERDVPKALVKNLEWLRGSWNLGDCGLSNSEITELSKHLADAIRALPTQPLFQVCLTADRQFQLRIGTSLNIARHSILNKWWRVPIKERIRTSEPLAKLAIDGRAPWLQRAVDAD